MRTHIFEYRRAYIHTQVHTWYAHMYVLAREYMFTQRVYSRLGESIIFKSGWPTVVQNGALA